MEEEKLSFAEIAHNIHCSVHDDTPYLILYFLAYFIGSIPFGLILAKISGHGDIRAIGSGNIGATNVLRTGNKKLAALTLLLDTLKSFAVVYFLIMLTTWHLPDECIKEQELYNIRSANIALISGLFTILGHCYPIWLKFKGGKGVATALGALLAAVPLAGLAACAAWLITAKITKISSFSALIAIAVAPIVTLFVYGSAPASICILITMLVWWRHRENIKRLLAGTEPKIGTKKKEEQDHPQS